MTLDQVLNLVATGSAPLIAVVMGLVEWSKTMGAEGKITNAISMILGAVLGGLYLGFSAKPTDPLGILLCVIYGLLIGLSASGIYKLGGSIAAKAK